METRNADRETEDRAGISPRRFKEIATYAGNGATLAYNRRVLNERENN